MYVSVVFSFRNEEDVLEELVRRIVSVFNNRGYLYELIFVNDASTDGSFEILQRLRADNDNIKIINMSRRFGVTPCVLAGFRKVSGEVVVYMDSDLQDPPEIIPELIDKYKEGSDVVHTVRTRRMGESGLKMWLTKKAYRVIGLFSDVDLVENSGDFKLFSRKALDHILSLPEHDPYMRGLAVWIGFQQSYLLYERDPRYDGESKFGLLNSLNPYKEFIRGITSFSEFPLYFALISGLLATAMSIGLIVYMVVTKFLGMNIPGWTAIMVAILFFGGSILSTVGILGVYVGKIFSQSKGRPMYIVENEIGFKVDDR